MSIIIPNEEEFWLVTLTFTDGLTDEMVNDAKLFLKQFEWCLATLEYGSNGTNPHIHAMFHSTRAQSTLRDWFRKAVYKDVKDLNTHALKLEKVKKFGCTMRYISKEVDSEYFYRSGFQKSWINAQLESMFGDRKNYFKWKSVSVDQAPHCIIEWCKLKNIKIDSKDDFKEVIIDLMSTINTKLWIKHLEWIYSQVMLEFKDRRAARAMIDGHLRFL